MLDLPDVRRGKFGEVARLHFVVEYAYENRDPHLFEVMFDRTDGLETRIKDLTRETLGPEFVVMEVSYRRGSLEVLVIIGAAYVAVSRYKGFIESLELLATQVRDLLRQWFPKVAVSGGWQLPAFLPADSLRYGPGLSDTRMLVIYLILSHAALLGFVLWSLLKG